MRIVAKIGSSSLVGEDGKVDVAALARIADDLAAVRAAGSEVILVSSGAIATGLGVMGTSAADRPHDLPSLQAASAIGQGALFAAWASCLTQRGIVAGQVLLTMQDVSHRAAYVNARNTLTQLLAWGAVPIVNENDTTATDEISFGDNDALAAQVAVAVGAEQLLLMTDVAGIYDRPPAAPGAQLLERIESHDELRAIETASSTSGGWGTGGMHSKLVAAEMASIGGVTTQILGTGTDDAMTRAAAGERVGTMVDASAERGSSYRLWLRYGKPAVGSVTVDDGAVRALTARGASLLAVGLTGLGGDFRIGDAVSVLRADGTAFAKGIVQFDAGRLRPLIGAPERDGVQGQRAVIHRDQLVLLDPS